MTQQRNRRRLVVASSMLIVVAILHSAGNISPPADVAERLAPLKAEMQRTTLPIGLVASPSVWDIQRSLVFTMSICLLLIGGLGLLVALDREASSGLRIRTAGIATVGSAALTGLYAFYGVAPPLLMLSVVTLSFAYAWARHQSE